jgi:hypothetical protein
MICTDWFLIKTINKQTKAKKKIIKNKKINKTEKSRTLSKMNDII